METMNAVVVEGVGKISYKKLEAPKCGESDVIVEMERSGVCSTDVVRAMRTGFYKYPIVPGHEFSGTVVAKGRGVTNVEAGDRVTAYPLIPCKKCVPCLKRRYNLCDNYDYLGSRCNGGYSELVRCPAENVVKVPNGVSFEEAAMTEPASVALHAVRTAGKAETAVIMGLGPLGILVAQWAKSYGVKTVIGIDRNDNRLELAKSLGVDSIIDTRESEASYAVSQITQGAGADVVFECSGSDDLQIQAFLSAAKGGKIVLVGNPARNLVLEPPIYSLILRRELSLSGSWNSLSSENEWSEALNAMKEKRINTVPLITHTYHLSEAPQIIFDMHFRRFLFSKVQFYR